MGKIGWIVFSVVVVALIVGLVVWTRATNPPLNVSGVNGNSVLGATAESGDIGDNVKGKADSKVLLVEYGDFQCPSCKSAHPNVNTLLGEYDDRIAFVFRNFPLASIHPNAKAAAAAAEAAGLQGKYWQMYNSLFDNQDSWKNLDASQRTEAFKSFAAEFGVDQAKFDADFAGDPVSKKLAFDQALGRQQGVSATPTFFLNGKQLDEATASGIVQGDLSKIKAELDKLLK